MLNRVPPLSPLWCHARGQSSELSLTRHQLVAPHPDLAAKPSQAQIPIQLGLCSLVLFHCSYCG